MERNADVARDRVYQDFEPVTRWESEPGLDILLVTLPGFREEQLKVKVTTTRRLRLLGERPAGGNKWIRFHKEFPIQGNIDAEAISAKFENGTLSVKHPRYKPQEPETQNKQPPAQQPPMGTAKGQPQMQEAAGQKPMKEPPETNTSNPFTDSQTQEEKERIKDKFTDSETNKEKKVSKEAEKYKDKVVRVVKEAQTKKQVMMNLVAAILVVLLLVLYATNAVRSSIGISDE